MSDKNELKRLIAYAKRKGLKISFVGQMTLHDYAAMNPVEGKAMGWDIGKNEIEIDKHRPLNKQVKDLRHEFVEMGLMKSGQPYAEAHVTALKLEGVKLTPPELDALAKIGSYSVTHIHDDGDLTVKTPEGTEIVVTTSGKHFIGGLDMPAKSDKQRRFAGAELGRLRAGKPTQSGMTEKQLEELASKENHDMPHKRDDRETNTRHHRISERPIRITERPAIRSRKPVTIGQHRPRIY